MKYLTLSLLSSSILALVSYEVGVSHWYLVPVSFFLFGILLFLVVKDFEKLHLENKKFLDSLKKNQDEKNQDIYNKLSNYISQTASISDSSFTSLTRKVDSLKDQLSMILKETTENNIKTLQIHDGNQRKLEGCFKQSEESLSRYFSDLVANISQLNNLIEMEERKIASAQKDSVVKLSESISGVSKNLSIVISSQSDVTQVVKESVEKTRNTLEQNSQIFRETNSTILKQIEILDHHLGSLKDMRSYFTSEMIDLRSFIKDISNIIESKTSCMSSRIDNVQENISMLIDIDQSDKVIEKLSMLNSTIKEVSESIDDTNINVCQIIDNNKMILETNAEESQIIAEIEKLCKKKV